MARPDPRVRCLWAGQVAAVEHPRRGTRVMGQPERPLNLLSALVMALGLGGCTSLSAAGGMTPVQGIAFAELQANAVKVSTQPESIAAAERVAALLKRPLTPGSAVQI